MPKGVKLTKTVSIKKPFFQAISAIKRTLINAKIAIYCAEYAAFWQVAVWRE
jgi:hypothetical protein